MAAFRTKVKQNGTYLVGSAAMDMEIESSFWLFVRVDEDGESIQLEELRGDKRKPVGVIGPGESWLVRLNDVNGVCATCASETFVDCEILTHPKWGI